MNLEKEVTELKKLVLSFINQYNIDKGYTKADTNGVKQNINNVDTNAKEGINTNSANIDYVAMMCDVEIPTEE